MVALYAYYYIIIESFCRFQLRFDNGYYFLYMYQHHNACCQEIDAVAVLYRMPLFSFIMS